MTSYKVNNNGYDYVDLGLPSGTLWATMNVGASKPTDYGLYFKWGDTIGYTTDQFGLLRRTLDKLNPSGDKKTFTKYTNTSDAANIYIWMEIGTFPHQSRLKSLLIIPQELGEH